MRPAQAKRADQSLVQIAQVGLVAPRPSFEIVIRDERSEVLRGCERGRVAETRDGVGSGMRREDGSSSTRRRRASLPEHFVGGGCVLPIDVV